MRENRWLDSSRIPIRELHLSGTVDKALELLSYFSAQRSQIGLSEISKLAGYNKATTRRLLVALQGHGMLEQLNDTKKYRLGPAFLRLARVREAAFPVQVVVQPIVEQLAAETGETAHFSLALGSKLGTISLKESPRANRVSLEPGETLPLHATASGIAYLAFAPSQILEDVLSKPLVSHTDHTLTDPARIRELVDRARKDGHSRSDQGYETEVVGIAAPVFEASGYAQGAIAVATPFSRMTEAAETKIFTAVRRAAVEITCAVGAVPHPVLLKDVA